MTKVEGNVPKNLTQKLQFLNKRCTNITSTLKISIDNFRFITIYIQRLSRLRLLACKQ